MPRYYFNVHNVSPSAGDSGEELPDNEAAWQRATVIAGAALFKDDGMFRPGQEWALEVTDEARKPIYFIEIAAWQAELAPKGMRYLLSHRNKTAPAANGGTRWDRLSICPVSSRRRHNSGTLPLVPRCDLWNRIFKASPALRRQMPVSPGMFLQKCGCGIVGHCLFDLSPMAKLIMSANCSIKNGLCRTGLSANKAGLPAGP
jgi:hypothetical protein